MKHLSRRPDCLLGAAVLILLLLAGCAAAPPRNLQAPRAYVVAPDDPRPAARYAPIVVSADGRAYNRLGTPAARLGAKGREEVYVDPAWPTFYVRQRGFEAGGRPYTNFIYRLHFQKVPFLHLTSGKNGGLFIIVTVAQDGHPLLITTVHTCGCYLAFVPTSYLPATAWPPGWRREGQRVFGIRLPGILQYPETFTPELRPVIFLRDATHRVADIKLGRMDTPGSGQVVIEAGLRPLEDLDHLPLADGRETSFFHARGFHRGYVKNAFKPFELLLMSWWVLDPHVGVDKRYGERHASGTVFYTSLWPWNRSASDMWDFAAFLRFWGWRLDGGGGP